MYLLSRVAVTDLVGSPFDRVLEAGTELKPNLEMIVGCACKRD